MNDVYEEFHRRANDSSAFSRYCHDVFGIDLSQDGFSDKSQLDDMIHYLGLGSNDTCLDIGCGNGKISEYIRRETQASIHGFDSSPSAINFAREKIEARNARVSFSNADINNFKMPKGLYTAAILIDTMYFSNDYAKTLSYIYEHLVPGGRIGIFYSEFVFEKDKQIRKIEAHQTRIAEIIKDRKWDSKAVDFTDAHYDLMKRKHAVSAKYKDDFEREGNSRLYQKLHTESVHEDTAKEEFIKFTNRYLYCISKT